MLWGMAQSPQVTTPPVASDPSAVPVAAATLPPVGPTERTGRGPAVRAALPVLAVLLLWASAFIAIRFVAGAYAPVPLALGRILVGTVALAVILAVVSRRRGVRPTLPRGRSLGLVVGYGVAWFAAYTVALNAAEHHLDAGTAAMVVNVAPLLVALTGGLLLGEGFPRRLLVGLLVGFAGVALIAGGGRGVHADGTGIALGLLAALLYAGGVLLQKVALRTVDAVTGTFLGCLAGAVVLLPWLPQLVHQVAAAPIGSTLAVVYLGVGPTAVAFILWARALRVSDAGRLTTTTLAVPAITVLLSWGLLGEVPTGWAIAGGALALGGVAVSRTRPRRRA